MSKAYAEFFEMLTGHRPYPYQVRLGREPWPDLLQVPTGLGKTAAVVVAWIWKRLHRDPDTPRRLVYCLPMRVLVEQTAEQARTWLERAAGTFADRGSAAPKVSILMGGEVETEWSERPEEPALIIGTQDMLLSRALMRGYGMSRYAWPVHFALLHNDAVWVFDEIQLMGPGLSTSAQLEAFRRSFALGRSSRSLWMSATLDRDWLGTVDFRKHLASVRDLALDDEDRAAAAARLRGEKRLTKADVRLDKEGARSKARAYAAALAERVLEAHREDSQTLVVTNRVSRAQAVYRELTKRADGPTLLLLHARFRPAERSGIERELRAEPPTAGRIVVATQAIEAGVDISSATLFSELAPWPSLVQRFGRCNRYGEIASGADIYWIDLLDEASESAPYEAEPLAAARSIVEALASARIDDLPPVRSPRSLELVLRRKDFLDLFDTEPDLSGFDIDVSPYIRDRGTPGVQVCWREFENRTDGEPLPARAELCPASMGQIAAYLKKKVRGRRRPYWIWDALEGRWRRGRGRPIPGSTLLLQAGQGGYSPELGFDSEDLTPVPVVGAGRDPLEDTLGGDPGSTGGRFVSLTDHLQRVERRARELGASLGLAESLVELLAEAALWHDVGKAHPAFQTALLDFWGADSGGRDGDAHGTLWAKSSGRGRLRYRIGEGEDASERRFFRHEVASLLALLEHAQGSHLDLLAYLVASHHGKVRTRLRALPDEPAPGDGRRYARGVWEGDELPAIASDGISVPRTKLRLDVMEMGRGNQGPSWTERMQRLLLAEGPFQLAWLEALLRTADGRASAEERDGGE